MRKRESKKDIESRIRKELLNEKNENESYESKKRSSAISIGIIGAIIGIIFVSFTFPYSKIVGIILGGISGGMIGVYIR